MLQYMGLKTVKQDLAIEQHSILCVHFIPVLKTVCLEAYFGHAWMGEISLVKTVFSGSKRFYVIGDILI